MLTARSAMTTWDVFQVGARTMQTRPHTNIELPNDKYSDYHFGRPGTKHQHYLLYAKIVKSW